MWIQLDDRDFALVMEALRGNCSDKPDEPTAYDPIYDRLEAQRANHDAADPYREYLMGQADDEMEVDEDANVSPGADPGCFVQAWFWVSDQQIGVFTCDECDSSFTIDRRGNGDCDVCDECYRAADDQPDTCDTCGEPLDEAGDGYDCECADCADKTAAKNTYPKG